MKCPFCESEETRHSHSHTSLERALRLFLGRKYYRCNDCNARWSRFEVSFLQAIKLIALWIAGLLILFLALWFLRSYIF
jgi:transcriptional regulator NrdR family protein